MLKVLISVITLILIFSSCSTAPELKRDNEHDSESETFIPKSAKGQNYLMDSKKNVIVGWINTSTYITSHKIYKAIGNDTTFKLLATLPPNATSYLDDSKELAFPTSYKLISVSGNSQSEELLIPINFGRITSINGEINKNGTPVITWTDDIDSFDGFLIQISTDLDTTFRTIKTVNTTTQTYQLNTILPGFTNRLLVKPFLIFKGDTTTLDGATYRFDTGAPSNLHAELVAEDSVRLTWVDNSDFEDGFKIYRDNNSTIIAEVPPNTTEYTWFNDFRINSKHEFGIQGFKSDLVSIIDPTSFTVNVASPIITNQDSNTENTFTFNIGEPSGINRGYTVLRSSNGGLYTTIGNVSKSVKSFTDTNLNKVYMYSYKVETKLSSESESISTIYGLHPTESSTIEVDNKLYSANEEKLSHLTTQSSLILRVKSTSNSGSILSVYNRATQSLEKDIEFETTPSIYFPRISASENSIVFLSSAVSSKVHNISVFDYNTEALIDTYDFELKEGITSLIYDVKLLSDDNYVLISSNRGLFIYNRQLRTLALFKELQEGGVFYKLAFSDNGSFLLAFDNHTIFKYRIDNGNSLTQVSESNDFPNNTFSITNNASFSSTGDTVAVIINGSYFIKDLSTGITLFDSDYNSSPTTHSIEYLDDNSVAIIGNNSFKILNRGRVTKSISLNSTLRGRLKYFRDTKTLVEFRNYLYSSPLNSVVYHKLKYQWRNTNL